MFDSHSFKIVSHHKIGPLRNPYGYILAVAEIGDVWMVRIEKPSGENFSAYFADYEDVIEIIGKLNGMK